MRYPLYHHFPTFWGTALYMHNPSNHSVAVDDALAAPRVNCSRETSLYSSGLSISKTDPVGGRKINTRLQNM